MNIRVELKPMMAQCRTKLGVFEKPLGQNMVLASTGKNEPLVHVAYICDAPGSPFNGLHTFRELPDAIKDLIVEETVKKLGHGAQPKVCEPPPPVVLDTEDYE